MVFKNMDTISYQVKPDCIMANNTENATGRTSAAFAGEEIHMAARAIFATMGSVMIVSGVVGNWLLIAVIFKSFVRKRCVHNLFLINLALADILTLGYWFTFFVFDLILGYHPVVNTAHCVANATIIAVLCLVSVTSLLSISLNRYFHVCHSHLYNRLFTLPRTASWCVVTWLLGIALALPPVWGSAGSYHYNTLARICSFNREGLTYPKVMVLVFSTFPMVLIGYWNFAIFRFWRTARMSLTSRYPIMAGEDQQRRRNLMARWRAGRKKEADAGGMDQGNELPLEQPTTVNREASSDREKAGVFEESGGDIEKREPRANQYRNETVNTSGVHVADTANHEFDAKNAARGDDEYGAQRTTSCDSSPDWTPRQTDDCKGAVEMDAAEADFGERSHDDELANQTSSRDQMDKTEQNSKESLKDINEKTQEDTAAASDGDPKSPMPISPAFTQDPADHRVPSMKRNQKQHANPVTLSLQKRRRKNKAREVAFVRSLFVVFVFMFISFIPYGIIITASSYVTVPPEFVILGNMLLFLNNALNWIVYGVMSPVFRKGYIKCTRQVLIACCRVRKERAEKYLNASQSSLMTTSLQRTKAENELEQSFTSQGPSGVL